MKKFLFLWVCILPLFANENIGEKMQVKLSFANEVIVVDLGENVASKSFLTQLPLELKFSDYVGKEKIANLAKRLDTKGLNGYEPEIGDLFYFSPWGNVGIFYEKQPFHSGLVLLGKLQDKEKSLEKLRNQRWDFLIKIEKF